MNLWKKETCFRNKSSSNQTLRPIRDLRLHPYIGYHNNGINCSINNDNPTLYKTKGLKYD